MKSSKLDFIFEHRATDEILTGINDLLARGGQDPSEMLGMGQRNNWCM
jgi:hypothetical protein